MSCRSYLLSNSGLAKLEAFAQDAGVISGRYEMRVEDLVRRQPLVNDEYVLLTAGGRATRLTIDDFDAVQEVE